MNQKRLKNKLTTRSQRFNYSWNAIKMKISRRQYKKLYTHSKKNSRIFRSLLYISKETCHMPKNPFSCLRRLVTFIVILSSFNPSFVSGRRKLTEKLFLHQLKWTKRNEWGECEEIKDRAEHQHIRSISFTTYEQEKISHHLWRQIVNMPTMELVF